MDNDNVCLYQVRLLSMSVQKISSSRLSSSCVTSKFGVRESELHPLLKVMAYVSKSQDKQVKKPLKFGSDTVASFNVNLHFSE